MVYACHAYSDNSVAVRIFDKTMPGRDSVLSILPGNTKELFKLDYMNKGRILNNVYLVLIISVLVTLPVVSGLKLKLERIDDCSASLNGQVINLEPLASLNGKPR